MKDYGLVSIIMPAYNAEKYIADAIKSVLAQTYTNFELIIVNDGSKDKTLEIIKSFKDERIKIIDLKENKGVSNARNLALDEARGKWIAFSTADDLWKLHRLDYLLFKISQFEYGKYFISDDVSLCYETKNGKTLEYGEQLRLWFPNIYKRFNNSDLLEVALSDFLYLVFQPIIPINIIRENGLYFSTDLNFGEDLIFYTKLYEIGLRLLIINRSFYLYRIRPGSLTDLNIHELRHKVLALERYIENEKDFSSNSRKAFLQYCKKVIEVAVYKKDKAIQKTKGRVNFTFNHSIKNLISSLFSKFKNPYRLICWLRLKIMASLNGGLLRN